MTPTESDLRRWRRHAMIFLLTVAAMAFGWMWGRWF